MKNLVLVAHGSRRQASNDEVRQLTEALRAAVGDEYQTVACAFLELAEPSIPDGIEATIDSNTREVVVLPYFLSAGRHVAEDIPGEVDKVRRRYPRVTIRIADYLGKDMGTMARLLHSTAAP